MTDGETIERVQQETDEDDENDDEEEVEEESESAPSHHEAFNCLYTTMKCMIYNRSVMGLSY
jgi:hypothetical protein